MSYSEIYNIPEIYYDFGIRHIVISPGSRNAPLTLAFVRSKKFKYWVIPDERVAAFIGMGMAQQINLPTILICTSGSALLNYFPAISESYYSNIPLIILSADRPPEWIGQQDGQTIQQSNVFGNLVKKSYNLPVEYDHNDAIWELHRIVSESYHISNQLPKGPVHLNFPFREPFYPKKKNSVSNPTIINRFESENSTNKDLINFVKKNFIRYEKILIIAGQENYSDFEKKLLSKISKNHLIPIVGDITSNLHSINNSILHGDIILHNPQKEKSKQLKPELLITIGKSILSKKTKIYFRKNQPICHWNINKGNTIIDTLQSQKYHLQIPTYCFLELIENLYVTEKSDLRKKFYNRWVDSENKILTKTQTFLNKTQTFSEFHSLNLILNNLPSCNLHLANSMSVRYGNLIGLNHNKKVTVYANRGTSGIDGCSSTAIGHALTSNELNVLITGDVAFFYDRNAFWHEYPLHNLRIILLNNHGGGIFRTIENVASLPELEDYFETKQKLNAEQLCKEHSIKHYTPKNLKAIDTILTEFFDDDNTTKLIEIESSPKNNSKVINDFFKYISKIYNNFLNELD